MGNEYSVGVDGPPTTVYNRCFQRL